MYKKLGLILGLVLVGVIAYNLISQIISTLKSGDRLDLANSKLEELENKNKELKKRLEEVNTPGFIEEEARNKLGLAKDGETVVIIPDDKIDLILNQKKAEKPRLPNYLGWWKVFFN